LFDKINRRWFNFFLFRKNFQGASKWKKLIYYSLDLSLKGSKQTWS
jgi:hypothetical protein